MPFLSLGLVHNALGDFHLNQLLVFHCILISHMSVHCGQLTGTQLRPVSPQLGLQGEVTQAEESKQGALSSCWPTAQIFPSDRQKVIIV